VEDDDYRIHYTITSPAFRRLHFSAVEMNNTCKAAEIFGANESYSSARFSTAYSEIQGKGLPESCFDMFVYLLQEPRMRDLAFRLISKFF
jgi:hypothetical protein